MTDPMSQANHYTLGTTFSRRCGDLLQAQPKIAAALDADNSAYFATILLQATLVSGAYQLLHTHEYIVGIGLRWFAVTDEVRASRTLHHLTSHDRLVWSCMHFLLSLSCCRCPVATVLHSSVSFEESSHYLWFLCTGEEGGDGAVAAPVRIPPRLRDAHVHHR